MVKPIVKDIFFLGQKSTAATKADMQVAIDLQDTLRANRERCVGLAANMIGVKKNVIIVNMGFIDVVMFNPVIVKKDTPYQTEEGCLSLEGVRPTTRYENIEVEYMYDSVNSMFFHTARLIVSSYPTFHLYICMILLIRCFSIQLVRLFAAIQPFIYIYVRFC